MKGSYKLPLTVCLAGAVALSAAGCSKEAQPTVAKDSGQTEKLTIKVLAANFTEVPDMNNELWSGLEKLTNTHLDIQWIPSGEYKTKTDLILASGDIPEVTWMVDPNAATLINAINQGVFWELGPLLGDFSKYPNFKNNIPANTWKFLTYGGKTYGLPGVRPKINVADFIRTDWLEKVGLPMPTTLEELHTALKKIVSSDVDGNGKADTLGIMFDESYASAFGSLLPQYNEEGGLYHTYLTDAYTDMVEWYSKLYADGLMSKEFSTMKNYYDLFGAGNAAFYRVNPWHQFKLENDAKKADPNAKVQLIPYLMGPKGSTAVFSPGYNSGLFISKKVPEAKVVQILEYYNKLASAEITEYLTIGAKGIHHNVVNGEVVMTDKGKKQIDNTTIVPTSTLKDNPWSKTDSPLAPQAINLKNREIMAKQLDADKFPGNGINPFTVIRSVDWSKNWPKYNDEFVAMRTKAIMGAITMDQYKKYIQDLRNKSELKKVFKEFADQYQFYFGKK